VAIEYPDLPEVEVLLDGKPLPRELWERHSVYISDLHDAMSGTRAIVYGCDGTVTIRRRTAGVPDAAILGWLNPDTGKTCSAAEKLSMENHQGAPGKTIAAGFSVPLVRAGSDGVPGTCRCGQPTGTCSSCSGSRFPVGVQPPDLRQQWADAYAAFKGAFDTPQMRRNMPDEFSADARRRLREFDELMSAYGVQERVASLSGKCEGGVER
jgi:hypothetical protein